MKVQTLLTVSNLSKVRKNFLNSTILGKMFATGILSKTI